jgi:hypothetical protein
MLRNEVRIASSSSTIKIDADIYPPVMNDG